MCGIPYPRDIPRRTAAEADETRLALIRRARTLFADRGYDGVSADTLAREAGVTRGALYHHFNGKAGLFRAVLDGLLTEQSDAIGSAVTDAPDAQAAIRSGCRAFLDYARRREYRRIVLIDAPAVLGVREWQRLDDEATTASLRTGLREAGVTAATAVVAAEALSGAMNQLSLWIGRADTGEADNRLLRADNQINRLLDAILPA